MAGGVTCVAPAGASTSAGGGGVDGPQAEAETANAQTVKARNRPPGIPPLWDLPKALLTGSSP
jgi:hypothetical protein